MGSDEIRIGTAGPVQPPVEQFEQTVTRSEEKGWNSVWWPDHFMGLVPHSVWDPDLAGIASHQASPHTFLETLTTMGYAASITDSVQLGTEVTDPLRRHPIMLAQSFQTLHHLSNGRMLCGLGPGVRENTEPYGIEYYRPVSQLEEALEIMRLAWETDPNETIDYDGEFWTLKNAVFGLPDYDGEDAPAHPDILLGAHGPRMLGMTGKYADGWLPYSLSPSLYKEFWGTVADAAKDTDRDPEDLTRYLATNVMIDETRADCEELLDSLLVRLNCLFMPGQAFEKHGYDHPLGDGLTTYIPTELDRDEALSVAKDVPLEVIKDAHLWGAPEDVVAKVDEYEAAGVEHLILINEVHLADPGKVGTSFKLLDEVREAVQGD